VDYGQLSAVLPDPEWVKLEHPDNDPDADETADWGELLLSVQVCVPVASETLVQRSAQSTLNVRCLTQERPTVHI
jgi:hypothetical protein